MPQRSIASRVQILEEKVTSLEQLPERVARLELQIVQLRDEMRGEFAATRAEMRAEMRAGDQALRTEMQQMREQLRDEIRSGDDETRRYMRVLHEEVLARIAIIGEPRRAGRKRR